MTTAINSQVLLTISLAVIVAFFCPIACGETIYVDGDAKGTNDGTSWENAYVFLQDALADANDSEKPIEIHVAKGNYTPDHGNGYVPGDKEAKFLLKSGVTLKGGFAGVGNDDPNAWDHQVYKTVLSGDLNGNDERQLANFIENSDHVIWCIEGDTTAVLDGFTITGGYATDRIGGGMFNNNANPTVRRCVFFDNYASQGGGMANRASSPAVIDCTFSGNLANYGGGGMYNTDQSHPIVESCVFYDNWSTILGGGGMYCGDSNPTIIHCLFINNGAPFGGGMYNAAANPTITNCTFSNNQVNAWGGGMQNEAGAQPTVTNCILWGNTPDQITTFGGFPGQGAAGVTYCNIQGGHAGEGNIDLDPLFADVENGDYHLKSQAGRWDPGSESWIIDYVLSPCIDAGNPNSPIDLEPAPNGGRINMGAYGGTQEASKSTSGVREYHSEDIPKEIPGLGTETSTLVIMDAGLIVDLDVKLNISHPWDAELDIYLIAPDGTRVELFTDVGGMSENFTDTTLDDQALVSIVDGSAPFTGSYRPEGSLGDFNTKEIQGTWTLEVTDDWSSSRSGILNSWSLIATTEVKEPLSPPVIQAKIREPDGTSDTIHWDDVGEIRQYVSRITKAIPDEGKVTSTLVIDDFGTIEDLNLMVNINHESCADLDVYLITPNGTRRELFTDVGGTSADFKDTVLDDEALLSLSESSPPFTGSYRPEGTLSDAIDGEDIHGVWTLEITDDSPSSSGTLSSWSLIADLADILYYAECSPNDDFDNAITSSGWIVDKSYTFTELSPRLGYYYRVKARPLVTTWSQNSKEDFETGTLTDVDATSFGDLILADSPVGVGPQVHVIDNPSFDWAGIWRVEGDPSITLGAFWADIWGTSGPYVAGASFSENYFYSQGDWGRFFQNAVDWTGVETLKFDLCSINGGNLTASVIIGQNPGTVVWSMPLLNLNMFAYHDMTIDVSAFSGPQRLTLQVSVDEAGSFSGGVLWDNLRTYGPSARRQYENSGTIVSAPINLGENETYDILVLKTTTPPGTTLTFDVLTATDSTPIDPWREIPTSDEILTLIDLSGLSEKTIRLRANLSTSDPDLTPVLHAWSIGNADSTLESAWSNVVSSSF